MSGRRTGSLLYHPESAQVLPVDLGTFDIRPYLRLAGNQAYSIPNGTYTAGDLSNGAPISTTGLYGGYTVLLPTSAGGVTVDQSPPGTALGGGLTANGDLTFTGANFGGTTARKMMVGFKFRNGIVNVNAPKIRFWYPDMTFPAAVWIAEPGFATKSNYHHYANRLLYPGSDACEVYGGTFHDSSTALYMQAGASNTKLVGCDISSLDNGGFYGDAGGDHGSHPDCFADVNGNNNGITITDSYFHPGSFRSTAGIQIQDYPSGTVQNIVLARLWINGAADGGLVLDSSRPSGGRGVFGTAADVYSWGNGVTDSGGAAFNNFIEYVDGAQINYTLGSNPQPLRVNLTTTRSGTVAPPGFGTVPDPATAWRAVPGQALADWASFLSGNWP